VNRTLGTTLVLITHNAAIGAMGDTVVRMRSGRIVETTTNAAPLSPGEIEW
jgi:putative ABC transport system ATP-binding protein